MQRKDLSIIIIGCPLVSMRAVWVGEGCLFLHSSKYFSFLFLSTLVGHQQYGSSFSVEACFQWPFSPMSHLCHLPSDGVSEHLCSVVAVHHVSSFLMLIHHRTALGRLSSGILTTWPIHCSWLLTNMASTLSMPALCSTSPLQTLSGHFRPIVLPRYRSWTEDLKHWIVILAWGWKSY